MDTPGLRDRSTVNRAPGIHDRATHVPAVLQDLQPLSMVGSRKAKTDLSDQEDAPNPKRSDSRCWYWESMDHPVKVGTPI